MKTYKLSSEEYEVFKTIKYLEEMGDNIIFNDEKCEFSTNDIGEVEDLMNEYISLYGMDEDQNKCTEYGRKLYGVYDSILDQI